MIRSAHKEDVEEIIELMKVILIDMELPVMQKVPWKDLKSSLVKAAKQKAYRFNFTNAKVKEIDGRIVGFFYGYKGGSATDAYESIDAFLEKYNLTSDETYSDEESLDGEWYLDMLVIDESYRNKGIGSELLKAAFVEAEKSGMTAIGLNVDKRNPRARDLYERMGFEKVDELILSDHLYDHLQKKL
ncbi:GNAT family N-acetyltransferase [Alkalibacterium kapii]|uniref:N-acetyltransferase n=1 Tax=Alkalibacterium kapii TaxID=426704 RepID=A0A511AWA1_9LACT|nr:GNAT family N-acetyltransferase [Alkalibacterium kapii]GEK91912.1 N-acetyltransferase [Alkalibacterium kapii]